MFFFLSNYNLVYLIKKNLLFSWNLKIFTSCNTFSAICLSVINGYRPVIGWGKLQKKWWLTMTFSRKERNREKGRNFVFTFLSTYISSLFFFRKKATLCLFFNFFLFFANVECVLFRSKFFFSFFCIYIWQIQQMVSNTEIDEHQPKQQQFLLASILESSIKHQILWSTLNHISLQWITSIAIF